MLPHSDDQYFCAIERQLSFQCLNASFSVIIPLSKNHIGQGANEESGSVLQCCRTAMISNAVVSKGQLSIQCLTCMLVSDAYSARTSHCSTCIMQPLDRAAMLPHGDDQQLCGHKGSSAHSARHARLSETSCLLPSLTDQAAQ